ncbi:cobyrinate a,c-diamide synthase [Pseudobacteriovorax antillogorgiicola]|uniref:Cobyrinate a,c-diamide synthase n=1 Tax=Pseudobacteriovorax antillogorgiicola TaxID=1513793 RepID=A0A1Y6C168_9BACT|nr:cobyrinate a,c-diamide synthase [Pseudobacteriovorax antillogorgiicola]TCS50683.1 hydrogenobyrinic acid a,c-diamide synthase (glutamine-hydrolysing) /cobyrinate a,c-diamide synthase [Pseudobacteriovorax antillogorgiicola]SMF40170.1 hydrogenobyrinic acid a,c-diamide synthase (glutamine-hydrolysing) /cobyrinate a,c-diamide synthase [Pseudobacteriovorax antillogorgiicola]
MAQIPRLVVAGLSSGVGKTTCMVGLTIALRRRGLKVASFKCGPDYLDPSYHHRASQQTCHNLDGWIMGQDAILETFQRASRDADIALIEGVMGLFDGASPRSPAGSSAEIARWLQAPVLVTVDASGMARTIAAIESGLLHFEPDLPVAGLITNFVGSQSHKNLLQEALRQLPVIGGLPKRPDLAFPERHLGLSTAREQAVPQAQLEAWADMVEEWFDIEQILEIAGNAPSLPTASDVMEQPSSTRCRIAYAWDEAFHFYYEDNLARLRRLGVELVPFSPIHDSRIPDADGLYLGGGYPELFATELANNSAMLASIHSFAERGKPIYGECGGLIYLCESLQDLDGKTHSMLGLLPGYVTMKDKLQALGYVEVETQDPSFLGDAGTRFRGHQFRYSTIVMDGSITESYKLRKRRNQELSREGFRKGQILGSYVHAHWASNPQICENFIQACEAFR